MFFKKSLYCLILFGLFLCYNDVRADSTILIKGDCKTNYLLDVTTKQKYCVATALENVALVANDIPKIESDVVDISQETELEIFDSIDDMEGVQMPGAEMKQ